MENNENLINELAQDIDISATDFKLAAQRFNAVKDYLEVDTYLTGDKPRVYLQGSFRLGTVIRPYYKDKDGNFDIDQVCELAPYYGSISAKNLKFDVGNKLKQNDTYKRICDPEGKRCWTLTYASEESRPGFHIDILPSYEAVNKPGSSINITHKEGSENYVWKLSNPDDYYRWFKSINVYSENFKFQQREKIFEKNIGLYDEVSDVPIELYRSPLQRAIQIMKRHRDVYFVDKDFKPISIIITTLTAHEYENGNVLETIDSFIRYIKARHQEFIENGKLKVDGKLDYIGGWFIQNPVHRGLSHQDKENFADKWNIEEGLPKAFFEWVYRLDRDLNRFTSSGYSNELRLKLPVKGDQENSFSYLKLLRKNIRESISKGQDVTNILLDLIHLKLDEGLEKESEITWGEIEEISNYCIGATVEKDVQFINHCQIICHQGRKLSYEEINRLKQIKNDKDDVFKVCCNILLETTTKLQIRNSLVHDRVYNRQLDWPIFRLLSSELLLNE